MVARMMILAIFAMSLDLLQGVTGLVSLGHAAYFGLAGYALALMSPTTEAGQPVVDAARRRAGGLGAGSRWSSASSWCAPAASTSSW
jgi:ABC-type branched-subunit amino acid transport system permease subunit